VSSAYVAPGGAPSGAALRTDVELPASLVFALGPIASGMVMFDDLRAAAPANVGLVPIVLPFREARYDDAFQVEAGEELDEIAASLLGIPAAETRLFGICSGAVVAARLTELLTAAGREVAQLVVYGQSPLPDLHEEGFRVDVRDEWLAQAEAESTPEALAAYREWLELLTPAVELDTRLTIQALREFAGVDVPVLALLGESDRRVQHASLPGWASVTSGRFRAEIIPGSHTQPDPVRFWEAVTGSD
jgi:surfactin synthase thioesterase subunit